MNKRYSFNREKWNIHRDGTPDPIGYCDATRTQREDIRHQEDADGYVFLRTVRQHAEAIILQNATDDDRVFLERPF